MVASSRTVPEIANHSPGSVLSASTTAPHEHMLDYPPPHHASSSFAKGDEMGHGGGGSGGPLGQPPLTGPAIENGYNQPQQSTDDHRNSLSSLGEGQQPNGGMAALPGPGVPTVGHPMSMFPQPHAAPTVAQQQAVMYAAMNDPQGTDLYYDAPETEDTSTQHSVQPYPTAALLGQPTLMPSVASAPQGLYYIGGQVDPAVVMGGLPIAPSGPMPAPSVAVSEHDLEPDEGSEAAGRDTYSCKHCCKQFTLKGNLKRHIQTHAGVKPYLCAVCNKGFSRKADLEIHNRVHTGEKPYECPFAGCGKRFARISDVRSHERTHSGIKAFKCPYRGCDRQFARRYDMRKHMKVHQKQQSQGETVARTNTRGAYHYADEDDDDEELSVQSEDPPGKVSTYPGRGIGGGSGGRRRRWSLSAWGNGDNVEANAYNDSTAADTAALRMQALKSATPDLGMNGGGGDEYGKSTAPLNPPARPPWKAQSSENRGYMRVLHNAHVEFLFTNRVLECREISGKAGTSEPSPESLAENGSAKLPKVTVDDVNKASASCSGEHGTDRCHCIRVDFDGRSCFILDNRLMYREAASGDVHDLGEFRILDDELLTFYGGINDLMQPQSLNRSGSSSSAAVAIAGGVSSASSALDHTDAAYMQNSIEHG